MNQVERFAGDSPIMQEMALLMQANDNLMRRRQSESLNYAYEARARDVAATGARNAGRFL